MNKYEKEVLWVFEEAKKRGIHSNGLTQTILKFATSFGYSGVNRGIAGLTAKGIIEEVGGPGFSRYWRLVN